MPQISTSPSPLPMANYAQYYNFPLSSLDTSMHLKEGHKSSGEREIPPARDGRFWYDDGSIILYVGTKLFRVHRSILSANSEIFADMFRIPQPVDQPLLEGCPLVTLTDSDLDFVNLLRALYNPLYFDSLPHKSGLSKTLDFISGILSLSTKYFILPFRSKCILLLKRVIPTTLEDYDSGSAQSDIMFCSESPTIIARAIILAQKNNVSEVLPCLYYFAARHISPGRMFDSTIGLSWEKKTVCLVGREMLRMLERLISHRFLYDFKPSPSCKSSLCAKSLGPLRQWRFLQSHDSPAPLGPFQRWGDLGICLECELHVQEQHSVGREAVWARLPSAFNLSSWDVLAKIQDI